jgi:hypothetical protein
MFRQIEKIAQIEQIELPPKSITNPAQVKAHAPRTPC